MISVTDLSDIQASTNTAVWLIQLFYNIVAIAAIILCFFTLSISFAANVKDNSWEFGVIRSIGLSVIIFPFMYINQIRFGISFLHSCMKLFVWSLLL